MRVLDKLRLPEAAGLEELDDAATSELHARVIKEKPLLRRFYLDAYQEFERVERRLGPGTYVEIGSGGGFLKDVLPDVITSDVAPLPNVDRCFGAEHVPFEDGTVNAFFVLNGFHHFADPEKALREFARSLRPGGRIVIVEPANTAWARFIYSRFHHEEFDPSAGWSGNSSGRLSGANGALPWIVFVRDRSRFERTLPQLRLLRASCHTPFLYLLSGGLSLRQLAPSWACGPLKGLEWALRPLNGLLGMFMTVELEKLRDSNPL